MTNREVCNALDRIAEKPPEPGMSGLATKRIQNELAAMQNDPPPGCVLGEMGDDIFRLEQSPPIIILSPDSQKTAATKDKSCGIKREVLKVEIDMILIGAQV